MSQYRKKPVVIEAFQFKGESSLHKAWECPKCGYPNPREDCDCRICMTSKPFETPSSWTTPEWFVDAVLDAKVFAWSDHIDIETLEGVMQANVGDWVIRGIRGELYPCKPDIFEATYELV